MNIIYSGVLSGVPGPQESSIRCRHSGYHSETGGVAKITSYRTVSSWRNSDCGTRLSQESLNTQTKRGQFAYPQLVTKWFCNLLDNDTGQH